MEMLNKAFEGADAFKKMLEKIEQPAPVVNRGNENRKQRRARERAEKKLSKRSVVA